MPKGRGAGRQRAPSATTADTATADADAIVASQAADQVSARRHLAAIAKTLERVTTRTGWRRSQVFDDWLAIVEASLEQLPAHLAHVKQHGRLLAPEEEPEAVQTLWRQIGSRYREHWPDVAQQFAVALHQLIAAAESGWADWLGALYMQWEIGNPQAGQYFTPWQLAAMMAQMQDPTPLIHERIKAALLHPDNALGQALLIGSLMLSGPDSTPAEAERFFVEQLVPAALPYLDPITVNDCACGSGVMLLAVAATVPSWANRYGIVQYSGQDIDLTCVRMARIQMMLYGLNGYAIRCAQALIPESAAAPAAPPPPVAETPATKLAIERTADGLVIVGPRRPPRSEPSIAS